MRPEFGRTQYLVKSASCDPPSVPAITHCFGAVVLTCEHRIGLALQNRRPNMTDLECDRRSVDVAQTEDLGDFVRERS